MSLQGYNQLKSEFNRQELSRKDKRRYNIESKVMKIRQSFAADKDIHYRDRLTHLQSTLTSLHQRNNIAFTRALRDLEEERDLELVRLRFFEEYRVHRSRIEFQEDIERTKEEHDRMIKLCKEKLYESFEKKIKKLKEDRMLMDVANAHSYVMDHPSARLHKNVVTAAQGTWDSSASEVGNGAGGASANESGTENGAERRTLRRRIPNHATARAINEESEYASNKESSASLGGSRMGNGGLGGNGVFPMGSQNNSDSEFLQYISDSNELHALLFGSEEKDSEKKKARTNQRLSTKGAPPLQSLTQDEVTEDIALIRQLTGQPPAPFKV
ncbi:HDL233Wp [Eremothecium sinecaudum]|uniref:HDL233Wp n=1 Tax=Eremothecium sinecaudum TaxID=45286 RepID=A0A0X8HS92_9SACH|nr:HDL233Wp [Eremothecium sinecaudum]AMD20511.1 HDL233Wp [Eremothecium sinecaudum]